MPGKKVIDKKRFSHLILLAAGLVSLNVFLIQAPLPAVAVVPGTPTATWTATRGEPPNTTGATNPERTSVPMTPTPQIYVVQAGENIYRIAQKFYGESAKYSLILEANKLNEDARIAAGTTLKIPYLATPTLTPTPTAKPSATVTLGLPTATKTNTPTATETNRFNPPPPNPGGESGSGELPAMVAMLTTFATSTLIGSSIICGLLAIWIYSSARRIANQQAMARRVRPPLRR